MDKDVKETITISHEKDGIAGTNPISGAKNNTTNPFPNGGSLENHSVNSFSQEEINRIVSTSNRNGKNEKWEQNQLK